MASNPDNGEWIDEDIGAEDDLIFELRKELGTMSVRWLSTRLRLLETEIHQSLLKLQANQRHLNDRIDAASDQFVKLRRRIEKLEQKLADHDNQTDKEDKG